MKILFYLVRFPAFGGIETVTNIIGTELVKSGDYVIDIITNVQGDRDMQLMQLSKIYVFPNYNKWCSNDNKQYFRKIIEEGGYDSVVYQDSYSGMENIVVGEAYKNNIPIYVFEHSSPMWFALGQDNRSSHSIFKKAFDFIILKKRLFFNRKSKKYLLDHCTRYVLLSDKFTDDLSNIVNIGPYKRKITSIPNPIYYSPIEMEKLVQKEKIILTVCQLNKTKNVSTMLEIWESLAPMLPDWRYIIVGDGPEREALENQVFNNRIKNVKFIGFSDPNPYYEKSKLFWMTSHFEGWPMTLVEAMQKGCVPIVMNTFSSLTEIVEDEVNGIIIPAYDINAFSISTIKLATDDNYLNRITHNAIKSVERFDVKNVIKLWHDLFENIKLLN